MTETFWNVSNKWLQSELQFCKFIIQIRWHIDYVEPWAHRYCEDTWTIFERHIYIWLVPVLIIPRSCSIVLCLISPPYLSDVYCDTWFSVNTVQVTHGYAIYFISSDGDLFSNLWSTHWRQHTVCDQITCMRCEFWLCCHQCTWWLSCKSSMYSAELNSKIKGFVQFNLSSPWWHWRGRKYRFPLTITHSQRDRYTHSAPKQKPGVGELLCQQLYLPALNPVRAEQKIKRTEYHKGVQGPVYNQKCMRDSARWRDRQKETQLG